MKPKIANGALIRLRAKLISRALTEPEFQAAIDEAVRDIRSGAKSAPNEATIESLFERVLYALLKEVGIAFFPEKESAIATKRHVGKGRADSRIGALVIEYKQRSTLTSPKDKQKAVRQLEEYLEAISTELHSEVRGFLTDGEKYLELTATNGAIKARGTFEELSKATLLRLIRAIYSLQLTALTPKNLIRDFARSDFEGEIFDTARLLESELATGNESDKTKMLRSEWEGLFKLAHDDQSQQKRIEERRQVLAQIFRRNIPDPKAEYRALFCLHTSYAITLKLMAFRVVCDVHFGSRHYNFKDYQSGNDASLRAFCERLEDGEVFRDLGFVNLLEGDFFSWYADKSQWSTKFADCVRNILGILGRYEDVESVFATTDALDLFRELYEASVPQIVRASFGEFHTPYWLAARVLEATRPTGSWTALDPCCGSGTFVIAAISRLRQELRGSSKLTTLRQILTRVCGFDLNPLSALTTRVSYFIHIVDLLPPSINDLTIPVYLGDASYVPETKVIEKVQCLAYKLRTLRGDLDVALPASIAKEATKFIKVMREVENEIRSLDSKAAARLLIQITPTADRRPAVLAAIRSVCDQLADLERKGWNGIWARIVSNFFVTASLPKFSCVVGNPPWIDWKNLPAGYREKIKSLCLDRGLFSGAGRTGGINLNICALIANVTSLNWVSPTGYLAFLMPKELLNQASYEGWRTTGPSRHKKIVELHDWSEAGHPFDPVKEDFMTFVMGPSKSVPRTLPVFAYSRKPGVRSSPKTWKDNIDATANLLVKKRVAKQIIPGSTAYTIAANTQELADMALVAGECAYIGREGIEFYPQELLLFKYVKRGPRPNTAIVQNLQVAKSKHRVPLHKRPLETKFLYPLVKGPNIEPFNLTDTSILVPFPYDPADPIRPINEGPLRKKAPLLYEYYRNHREIIKAQTKFSDKIRGANPGAYYGLARTGPYSFQRIYVAFRDNTKWCACVVRPISTPWRETKRMVFQNHAVSMCERAGKAGYITDDEAHYICAILNSPSVEKFLLQSSDMRSFKIRPPVYVPVYDKRNSIHKLLSRLSRKAHKKPARAAKIQAKIDATYLALCRAGNVIAATSKKRRHPARRAAIATE